MRKLLFLFSFIFILGILYLPLPPVIPDLIGNLSKWIPAFAGMTIEGVIPTAYAQQKNCEAGANPYVPGGECEKTVTAVHGNINLYPLTCQDTPIARLNKIVNYDPGEGVLNTEIIDDVSKAELGGIGPNAEVIQTRSADKIAEVYPWSAFFDKPLGAPNQPREASRTYWRLLSSYEQATAKATYLTRVRRNRPEIDNHMITFYTPVPKDEGAANPAGPGDPILGFNWGYGHMNSQACTDATDRPVTFLLPLTAGESMLNEFKNCFQRSNRMIVRITEITANTTNAQLTAAGTLYNRVFGSSGYVVLGNELNNLSREYTGCSGSLEQCGAKYASQFGEFQTTFKGNLSTAPLDTSNSDYNAADFLKGAITAYRNSSFIAANSYEGTQCRADYDARRCTKNSYQWLAEQIGGSKNIILTEYGLAPGSDTDLTEVLAFYQSLPSDVIAITPLIRNTCSNAAGEWLRLVNGKLFDSNNKEIDPQNCQAGTYTNLYPDTMSALELDQSLPDCLKNTPICETYLADYKSLHPRIQAAYDALMPFNFDNLRGYQVLRETVMAENLPYIQAMYDGLTNPATGLLNTLSPSFLNNRNFYTDLKNSGTIDPTVEQILYNAIILKGNAVTQEGCLEHRNATFLPAPYTFPSNLAGGGGTSFSQPVEIGYTSNVVEEPDPEVTGSGKWRMTGGPVRGQPVGVLNNPMMEDLNKALAKDNNSFVNLFTPSWWLTTEYPDRPMIAPGAALSAGDPDVKVESTTVGEGQSPIARTLGQVHTMLCELRNKMLIPDELQNKRLDCVDIFQTLIKGGAGAPPGPYTAQACYIISASQVSSCQYPATYTLTQANLEDKNFLFSCKEEDRIARGVTGPGTYNVCCPNAQAQNNTYSIKSAVCGNAPEIYPSCGVKGGVLFCWGNNYRADTHNENTDSAFPLPAEGSRKATGQIPYNRCIKYNAVEYCPDTTPAAGDLTWCDSNNIYCGAK